MLDSRCDSDQRACPVAGLARRTPVAIAGSRAHALAQLDPFLDMETVKPMAHLREAVWERIAWTKIAALHAGEM